MRSLVLMLGAALAAAGATRLTVTAKTGKPVTGLKAADFSVLDDKAPKTVEGVEPASSPLDIMLLLDTSLVGGAVQPAASGLIAQLGEKDEMAVVSYHSSADLIQQFTSSRELLGQAIAKVKYGNTPRLLDALYAAIDGGFENTVYRRVILVLTTGLEGDSRVTDKQVIRLARKAGVSIYTVYLAGREKPMFEALARQTGGACFNLGDLRKSGVAQPAARVFEAVRSYYTLTIAGNLDLGDKVKVEVRGLPKVFVSALPQE